MITANCNACIVDIRALSFLTFDDEVTRLVQSAPREAAMKSMLEEKKNGTASVIKFAPALSQNASNIRNSAEREKGRKKI